MTVSRVSCLASLQNLLLILACQYQLASQGTQRILEGCQDSKQNTLLSVLHRWGRNSPSGVNGHPQAWLELASARAANQAERLAAQLMTYNRLLGPGLLDLWLEQTSGLAAELSEANRAAAAEGCCLLCLWQLCGQLNGLLQPGIQQAWAQQAGAGHQLSSQLLHLVSCPNLCQLQANRWLCLPLHSPGPAVQADEQSAQCLAPLRP